MPSPMDLALADPGPTIDLSSISSWNYCDPKSKSVPGNMSSDGEDYEMSEAPPADPSSDVTDTAQASSSPSANNTPSNPAPSKPNTTAGNANTKVGSLGVTDPEDPFFVHSCNSASFKYKYPQAKPTPDGEDDTVWNRIYTAADSRMYNKHHKSANESRKYRDTGETRTLALRMLVENKEKHYKAVAAALAGGHAYTPKAAQKAKPPAMKTELVGIKKERSEESFDMVPGTVPMSISEKIKSEGRKRKTASDTPSSQQGTPAPTNAQKLSSPAPKSNSPAPTKMDKPPIPKKKGTAAPVKRPTPKRPKSEAEKMDKSGTPSSSVRQSPVGSPESNDGGEYCLCRGPDDHRMMVFCDGGCEDWYHCSCVNVDEDDARELLDRYICPKCTTSDLKTTWKRICRYINCDNGCRKGARVNEGSKYCSEEHLNMFFEWCYTKLRGDDQPSMGGALNRQEVADLLTSISTVEELHDLGKKPRLTIEGVEAEGPVGLRYILPEDKILIEEIQQKKKILEAQIEGYKKQKRLLKMINERAKVASQQPSLDVKAICGYDDRLAMNEAEFNAWLESEEGQKAFESDVLGPRTEDTRGIGAHILYPGQVIPATAKIADALDNICLKPPKKCKHQNWREIHNGDFIAMQLILMEQLNRLTENEKEIIDDAETREATKDYYADNVTIQLF
ncbi:related to SPP1 Subunit of the COMPASS complex, which methylates histone H3 on lysine 4 [Rhynchosporium agropyri]|uniref:Related to SPP1 Subunit of the COMPASS complex, which methylates histone H3 on lysine 4 n=1 Tax=Rhynchosporium agropyri TaxID=914238 RepID=A0A1E1KYM5_9HELO|nr:related to SPP1 Subunit of the COMPASS complex, which methylates histone H3 on lysine 4 [Rhynchosporium agropyri]